MSTGGFGNLSDWGDGGGGDGGAAGGFGNPSGMSPSASQGAGGGGGFFGRGKSQYPAAPNLLTPPLARPIEAPITRGRGVSRW